MSLGMAYLGMFSLRTVGFRMEDELENGVLENVLLENGGLENGG